MHGLLPLRLIGISPVRHKTHAGSVYIGGVIFLAGADVETAGGDFPLRFVVARLLASQSDKAVA